MLITTYTKQNELNKKMQYLHDSILSTIGNTPIVSLNNALGDIQFRLFAKLEAFNPGGSIKDRVALNILRNALENDIIHPDTAIIESSSGNLGIGLAQVCAYLRLRFICVIDPKTTKQNIAILQAYGAEIDLVSEPDPVTGEFLQARINRVHALKRSLPNGFWCDQYSNIHNAQAHHQTMHEIVTKLGKEIDYLFCATSTCGTMRGCAEYIREHGLKTKICAVDAVGSVVFGGAPGKRLVPGHGASRRPELYQPDLAQMCIQVSDLDCVIGCHYLLEREAILAGGSSGGILRAVEHIKPIIPPESTCVIILCDRGERYLDTIYSDEWVREHFGDVSHLWHR